MIYIGGNYIDIYNYNDFLNIINHSIKIGANCIQIFNGKITSTTINQKMKLSNIEIKNIKKFLHLHNIKLFIHSSLSLNLSNPISNRHKWILDNLSHDLDLGYKLGSSGVTVHVGTIINSKQESISNMVNSLNYLLSKSKIDLLIETSNGGKNKVANTIEDLALIYNSVKYKKHLGFTIDTCHLFNAGYDITSIDEWNNYLSLFDEYIGLDKIKLIHLNDSKTKFNSGTDIHENLMKGNIFKNNKNTLIHIINTIKNIPVILETRHINKYKNEIHFFYTHATQVRL